MFNRLLPALLNDCTLNQNDTENSSVVLIPSFFMSTTKFLLLANLTEELSLLNLSLSYVALWKVSMTSDFTWFSALPLKG